MTAAGVEDCYEAARHTIADKPGTSRILSKEEVVQANPDYIIIGTWSQGGAYKSGNAQLEELYSILLLATVTAVKKKQAIVIPQGYVNCLSQQLRQCLSCCMRLFTANRHKGLCVILNNILWGWRFYLLPLVFLRRRNMLQKKNYGADILHNIRRLCEVNEQKGY